MTDQLADTRMRPSMRLRGTLAAVVLAFLYIVVAGGWVIEATAATPEPGDTVQINGRSSSTPGYAGNAMYGIYTAGSPTSGAPDFWAYCLEQGVSARVPANGEVGNLDAYLGDNYFATDAVAQAKVLWILANSYPVLSLNEFGTASGIPGISQDDATEATQYAIWRFTELDFDASWPWESAASEAAYWHLIDGAHDSGGLAPGDLEVTASVTGPTTPQSADSLVGPFVVNTNQATVSVAAAPSTPLVDASGDAIDATAVVDGQEVYLDLRGSLMAGSATVTVTAQGATSGLVISVPGENGGTATPEDHAQSLILAAPGTATTQAEASTSWVAAAVPVIGTSLVDSADGDRVLPWDGGTVVDTVAYDGLTPGVEYTVSGELMVQSDGSGTGIVGSTTFTPEAASGEVEVSFVVPASFAGQSLVAFEWLYEGSDSSGDAVAEHTDIDDGAQTVTIERAPDGSGESGESGEPHGSIPNTGAEFSVAMILVALMLLGIGGGALIFVRRQAAPRHSR